MLGGIAATGGQVACRHNSYRKKTNPFMIFGQFVDDSHGGQGDLLRFCLVINRSHQSRDYLTLKEAVLLNNPIKITLFQTR